MKRATYCVLSFDATEDISIHALVKRATKEGNQMGMREGVSIHALVKRATFKCEVNEYVLIFQSTPS